MQARAHDTIQILNAATGGQESAVELPFHILWPAAWVDDGTSFVVNRVDVVSQIVMFDRFWSPSR